MLDFQHYIFFHIRHHYKKRGLTEPFFIHFLYGNVIQFYHVQRVLLETQSAVSSVLSTIIITFKKSKYQSGTHA